VPPGLKQGGGERGGGVEGGVKGGGGGGEITGDWRELQDEKAGVCNMH